MKEPAEESSIASAILFVLTGPILWAGHLAAVYALQSVTCAIGGQSITAADIVPSLVTVATLVAVGPLLIALGIPGRLARALRLRFGRGDDRVLISVSRLLGVLSLVGVLWTGSAALALDTCGQLR